MPRSRNAMDWFNGRLSSNGSSPWFTQAYEAATDTTWNYAILVTLAWQAVVVKWEEGTDPTDPLSPGEYVSLTAEGFPNLGNTYQVDSHNCTAICVDGLGHIHITGNTHDDVDTPIVRFNYIRSTNPHDISSWGSIAKTDLVGWSANSANASLSSTTYSHYRQFSDGGVIWGMSMSEGTGVIGRDIGLWYCAPNANEFLPAQGGTTTDIMRCTNNATDGADRSYMMSIHVDDDDVLHFIGVFREIEGNDPGEGADSQLHPFYMKSLDRGATWKNIAGTTITMPMTPAKVISDSVEILVDGTTSEQITGGGNMVIHEGKPYWCAEGDSGRFVLYHDGTVWRRWIHPNSPDYQINDVPSLVHVDDELWMFGYDGMLSLGVAGTAARQLGYYRGRPWSPASDSSDDWMIHLGKMIRGQHNGGPYDYDDGCILMPAEPHMGGKDLFGNNIARFWMPDGDVPAFRQVGGRGRAASL